MTARCPTCGAEPRCTDNQRLSVEITVPRGALPALAAALCIGRNTQNMTSGGEPAKRQMQALLDDVQKLIPEEVDLLEDHDWSALTTRLVTGETFDVVVTKTSSWSDKAKVAIVPREGGRAYRVGRVLRDEWPLARAEEIAAVLRTEMEIYLPMAV